MNWSNLTDDEVLAQFNDSETAAMDAAKGDTSGANLTDIIGKVTDQIRHAYRDGGREIDWDQPGSLPAGEKNRAIAMVRWLYLLALPTGKALQTEERKKAHDDATAYFLQIAQRKISRPGSVGVVRPGQRVQGFPTGTGGQGWPC